MKKILFVRTVPYDFNANTYNVQGFGLGKAFCRLGYDFDFLCFSSKEEKEYVLCEESGHKLTVIVKKRLRVFRTGINLSICSKEFLSQYEFVISCEYGQFMTYALSKASDNVVMYSGPYYNLFMLPFMSPIYDAIFTKSMNKNLKCKFVKSELAKEYLEKKGYTDLVNIGVALDIERFDADVAIQPETQKLMQFMKNNRCILYVGALSDRKNYPFILEVYKKLLDKNPDIKFVLIGKGKEKYVSRYMSTLTSQQQSNIYRLGKIDNAQLKYIYPLAKAFILPSKLEIFGMVLLEAMYLGAPVVTSWNGGSSTLIKGYGTGQIVKEFDVKQWCEAVQAYLDDEDFAKATTKKAKELISTEFVWETLAKKMLEAISKA